MQRIQQATLPQETPLQLAREMAECRVLCQSAGNDEAHDHWRGEYEAIKRRYEALLRRLKESSDSDN